MYNFDVFATSTCSRSSGGLTPYDCTTTDSDLDTSYYSFQCVPSSTSLITCYPVFNYATITPTSTPMESATTTYITQDSGDLIFLLGIVIFFLSAFFIKMVYDLLLDFRS